MFFHSAIKVTLIRHVDDFLTTGPEAEVTAILDVLRAKLNMADFVSCTGQEMKQYSWS